MQKASLVIVSPALADANNGNWQTARRWQSMLSERYQVRICRDWSGSGRDAEDSAMIALHARRSAASIQAWAQQHPDRGLAVVLTGTDLYRDIAQDAQARHSLELAQQLVLLQECAPLALPAALRPKSRVIFQSCSARTPQHKTTRQLRVLVVGHLREEKSPQTVWQAARLLRDQPGLLIDHVGAALEPAWAEQALAVMHDCPQYRWLGALPHEATRRRIQRAHLLLHPSLMEGGAHVIMEAVRSGTPVLASRVDGNVGMLGPDYAGYFECGDAAALADLLLRCRDEVQAGSSALHGLPSPSLLERLQQQCGQRAPLFDPARERAALLALGAELLARP